MKYSIRHRTFYQYEFAASITHNELLLVPRNTDNQTCTRNRINLDPEPSVRSLRKDYFGNTVISTTLESPHKELDIIAESEVVFTRVQQIMPGLTPPWEEVQQAISKHQSLDDLTAFEFTFPSPQIPTGDDYARFAKEVFTPGLPVLEAALGLINKIYTEFTYDPEATTAATPLAEAFSLKRGVCQDFAHIGIACLRSLGLPARYVSGYLHTQPPPGKPKLIGADASHAWLSLYIPGTGWIDLDPTNDTIPEDQHLTLAWGRDYGDVTPVRGTVLGGGSHQIQVEVDVNRKMP